MRLNKYAKFAFSVLLVALGGFRFWRYSLLKDRMDGTFLLLVLGAFLLWMIPWDQLSSFKAAGFEIFLYSGEKEATGTGPE